MNHIRTTGRGPRKPSGGRGGRRFTALQMHDNLVEPAGFEGDLRDVGQLAALADACA